MSLLVKGRFCCVDYQFDVVFDVLSLLLAVWTSPRASFAILDTIPNFRYSDITLKMKIYTVYSWYCF